MRTMRQPSTCLEEQHHTNRFTKAYWSLAERKKTIFSCRVGSINHGLCFREQNHDEHPRKYTLHADPFVTERPVEETL